MTLQFVGMAHDSLAMCVQESVNSDSVNSDSVNSGSVSSVSGVNEEEGKAYI